MAVPRLAKLKAINNEPAEVIIHARIAVLGLEAAAREAADVKIPDPIQLPTTMATAAVSPNSRFNSILSEPNTPLIFPIKAVINIAFYYFQRGNRVIIFVLINPKSPSAS
jgi:hypothetical protein